MAVWRAQNQGSFNLHNVTTASTAGTEHRVDSGTSLDVSSLAMAAIKGMP
jgi:hypothetical protein